jgi:Domain of unknown function (DUF1905)
VSEGFVFTAPLWRWEPREGTIEPGAWFFVTVPREQSEDIRDSLVRPPRGFGSVRVAVEVGSSRWRTSLFPDAGSKCYVLPVKKAVRLAESLAEGDELTITLTIEAP